MCSTVYLSLFKYFERCLGGVVQVSGIGFSERRKYSISSAHCCACKFTVIIINSWVTCAPHKLTEVFDRTPGFPPLHCTCFR